MPLYRDEAVVLRVHKLGEADRIVTLLTRRHGRVRAVGKGVRRTSSRFGARLEPGSHIDDRDSLHAVSAQHLVADLKEILGVEEWILFEQCVGYNSSMEVQRTRPFEF